MELTLNKPCPHCKNTIAAHLTRCTHCGEQCEDDFTNPLSPYKNAKIPDYLLHPEKSAAPTLNSPRQLSKEDYLDYCGSRRLNLQIIVMWSIIAAIASEILLTFFVAFHAFYINPIATKIISLGIGAILCFVWYYVWSKELNREYGIKSAF